MKNEDEMVAAFRVLWRNAENDFERHRIESLVRDLVCGEPKVEQVDDVTQKFLGTVYRKSVNRHHQANHRIYSDLWTYVKGEIPEGYVVHHKDFNPDNNDIDNLQLLTAQEHRRLHLKFERKNFKKKTFICRQCGKEYQAFDSGNNRYCSEVCRRKSRIPKKFQKQCEWCGKDFEATDKRIRFCSNSCARSFQYQDRQITLTCQFCGDKFVVPLGHSDRKFCSLSCAGKARWKGHSIKKICPVCGKEFTTQISENQKTCSRSCANKFQSKNFPKTI